MSRDVLIRSDTVLFLDRSEQDVTGVPKGASLISEEDWKALLGDMSEADYIASMGWKASE